MKQLIKITEKDGNNVVSARELHAFLEVKTEMVLWCKRMFEYGFTENTDYTAIKSENPVNKQVGINDYALTLDTAKEISMIQRSDKGKQARQYFIECEKKLKEIFKNLSPAEQLLHNAQILVNHEKQLKELKGKVANSENEIEELKKQIQEDLIKEKVEKKLAQRELALWWNRTDVEDLYK